MPQTWSYQFFETGLEEGASGDMKANQHKGLCENR